MIRSKLLPYVFSGLGACTLAVQGHAQVKKADVLSALNGSARYVADVILDKEGKSRCDYNLTDGKWYDYEVPWHTGQAVYSLLSAYKVTNNKKYLDAAVRGGNYWISMKATEKDPPKLEGMVKATHGDFIGGENIIFATISDGTPGIYELSRVTKNKSYAAVATSAADWMEKNMYYAKEGVCYDVVDIKTGEVMKENSPFWDVQGKKDQTLNDVSRPNTEGWLFKDAYEFSGQEKFKTAFINLCNSLVDKQGPEGLWMQFMPNYADIGSYHPRFNLWYAESLLEAYDMTKDRKYLEAAAKTARTYAKAQQKDGTLYYENFINGKEPNKSSVCGSAVAFAGIVWIRLVGYGFDEFKPYIEKSIKWIITNRYADDHPDVNLRGAILETRSRNKDGKIWLVNRDISTSFGVRFMADYLRYAFK